MILPANEVYISGIALKATTVTEDGEKLILTCIKPELWEVVSKIDFVGGGTALIGGAADTDEYGIATQANIGAGGILNLILVRMMKEKEKLILKFLKFCAL